MASIVQLINLILIISGNHFAEGKICRSDCGELQDVEITSCVIPNTGCDIVFPQLRIFDNFRFAWVEMNFNPHDYVEGTRKNLFEFQSTLRFTDNHTIHRFSVFIFNIARKDVLNSQTLQVGVSLHFSVAEVIAQDLGVYEISLVGDDISDEKTYITSHKYYLFMKSRFLLGPKCEIMNSTSSTIDRLPTMTCTLFGHFLPHVTMNFSIHPVDKNCTIIPNHETVPGITLVTANATSCRDSVVTCVANQTMETSNSNIVISRSCAFDSIRSSPSRSISPSTSSPVFVLNLTIIQLILILTIAPIVFIAVNLICWCWLVVGSRRRNVQRGGPVSVVQMQQTETKESIGSGNRKSASSFDVHCVNSAQEDLYENNADPFTKGPYDGYYDDI